MDSSDDSDSPEIETLDVSNDQHYQQVLTNRTRNHIHQDYIDVPTYGSSTIRHSLAAYDLWRPFFPTKVSVEKYRKFHRPVLRFCNSGPRQAICRGRNKATPIKNLSRHIYRSQKDLSNRIIRAINMGLSRDEIVSKFLNIRKTQDLTAKNGELFMFEYCEEHPPVLSQIGMASNIKLYVQPNGSNPIPNVGMRQAVLLKNNRDNINTTSQPKTTGISQDSSNTDQSTFNPRPTNTVGIREILSDRRQKPIYFNPPKAGTETLFIENNLYRAPIYTHNVDDCDFLVIKTRNSLYVRSFHKIFTVGQTMPLEIIPPPSEKAIAKFRSELLNVHIHKLFRRSPTVDVHELANLFPDYHISSIRRRLSVQGANLIGNGKFHRGTSKYGLLSLREERSILKPELYCLSMSMLANRERLRELNYEESMIMATDTVELETEVLAAPWNTSKAISETLFGRCYLDLRQHLIDPTGPQREGFSCVTWVKSPTEEEQKTQQRTPWTQQVSTQLSSIPSTNPMAIKIRREKLERSAAFQREAQLISNVQSKVLSSSEVLSSDEDSDAELDDEKDVMNSSFERDLKDLDRLVVDGRTAVELNFEREEEERIGLKSMLENNPGKSRDLESSQLKNQDDVSQYSKKVLKITRTYKNDSGLTSFRTELVREPRIIARYIKEKSTTNPSPQGSNDNVEINLPTPETTASPLPQNGDTPNHSMRRGSLGPSEFCRVDGTKVVISKSVLSQARRPRRCSNNYSFR